jgi:cytochrome b
MNPSAGPALRPAALVWDWPVRLFHWSLAILIPLAWWTAENGAMDWHKTIGYAAGGLIAFRLCWGVLGGSTARFSSFVRGPAVVFRYGVGLVTGRTQPLAPGHNPLGGWSVLALLGAVLAIVGLGLFAVDVDGEESGPLAAKVSFDAGRWAARWHHQGFNLLLGLIALHLCAIAFYAAVRRDNLVGPMLTGRKAGVEASLAPAPLWRLALSVFVGLAVAFGLPRL